MAVEELESTLAAQRAATYGSEPWAAPTANPDGIPDTEKE